MNFLKHKNEKAIKISIYSVTILVFFIVVLLQQKFLPRPDVVPSIIYRLPGLNALLNGTCSLLLIVSLIAIKKKNIVLHKKLNLTAFLLSAVFLLSYVTAHYFIPDTLYGDLNHDGVMSIEEKALVSGIKPVYLIILLTHILFAAIVLPFILLSFYYGLTDQRERHKKIVRKAFPVWLYVTITGVIVYLMISPYYNYP
jgi:putative membrane protein